MAEPLSNGAAYQSVPESYVFPEQKRPGSSPCSAAAIPVVDLGGDDHGKIVEQIIDAGREFGFFQVVNHGVADEVMREMMSSAEEFFMLPTEEKMVHYSTDSKKLPRFHSSVGNDQEKVLYWRDCLKLGCYPFHQFRQQWPEKPAGLRAALEAYTTAVRAVALRLLQLTAAGLGINEGHFEGELSAGPVLMNVNHYVPCPDPSLTLGLAPHCDPNLVTLLMENGVSGLQVLHGGGWVDVEPLPGALIVNFGHQMEVISNGGVRSGEHRVVTNARAARTSVATFVMPEMCCAVAPAPELVPDGEPPLSRPYTYEEFVGVYTSETGDRAAVLAHFQNKH
ncbi:2'-deoxymugineic-acid 2'-dioxygenase-like [Phragmites australis]|uniref:2'-deoxymugineic-acid 2'-dioxygenase-like n=1 Tax=Phragmites australis TaxID=29695 RepID=UPI002D781132|nr:2'-deoxymugineic-acid 2'-dioxygenase-like [Phragmites australis]